MAGTRESVAGIGHSLHAASGSRRRGGRRFLGEAVFETIPGFGAKGVRRRVGLEAGLAIGQGVGGLAEETQMAGVAEAPVAGDEVGEAIEALAQG